MNGVIPTRQSILDVSKEAFSSWLAERGQRPMRIKQIRNWIIQRGATQFSDMTDLPLRLRTELAEHYEPIGSTVAKDLLASDGTRKLLLRLADDELIECVLLREDTRRTACISTQVGCGMGCVFCASGLDGLKRNLSVGEILEQLVRLRHLLPSTDRLTHIVVMGMGEPLANLDNLLAALAHAGAKEGLGIGARHITISTVGLPEKIRKLADLQMQYHLAVSLHAPTDEARDLIVPTNPKTGLGPILDAADYFYSQTGRQVTFEIVLLRNQNDSAEDARRFARLLSGRQAHVNLIPFNDVDGLPYRRPLQESVAQFVQILRMAGVSVKVRKRKGSDIDAACGQLRRSNKDADLVSLGRRF